jgi:MFS family permease
MTATHTRSGRAVHAGGWAPLAFTAFRRLWLAQFTSNVGGWMQTVAAQWVMISLTRSAFLLSAISAASSIPVLLLAVPAGVLGDLVDRRRLIIAAQAAMLLASVVLAVLSAAGLLTPWVLLALIFAIGVGGAASAPTWQTLQPELVPAEQRPQAIALGSVNQNLARAVGPAIGGVLLAATAASVVFFANAASFLVVLAAVAVTRIPGRASPLPAEHAIAATRAGERFVRNSPELVALIARAVCFIVFAGAIWALLPIVAQQRLGLGSTGYGLLLGCVGLGAMLAATFGPTVKRWFTPRTVYAGSCLIVAGAAAVLGVTHSVALAVPALIAAGAAWILGIGLLGAAYQGQMPPWVKARGISYYLIAFQGSNAIGALALGAVAQAAGVQTAFFVITAGLLIGVIVSWRLSLPQTAADDGVLAEPMPLPALAVAPEDGPVRVTVEYQIAAGDTDAFLALASSLRRMRRRTGAVTWNMYCDAEMPLRLIETFVVGSWEEHERQHSRLEVNDVKLLADIDRLLASGHSRSPHHAFALRVPRHHNESEPDDDQTRQPQPTHPATNGSSDRD